MHELIKEVFNKLELNSIDFLVLRNDTNLCRGLPKGDIDVLVKSRDLGRLEKILKKDSRFSPYHVSRHANVSIDLFIPCRYKDGLRGINFEFRCVLSGYNRSGLFYSYLSTDKLLSERNYNGCGIPILSVHHTLIHLYHEYHYEGKLKYKDQLLDSFALVEINRIMNFFKNGRPPKNILSKEKLKLHYPIIFMLKKYALSTLLRIRRFLNPPGFLVVLLGPDGSGKTTIADALANDLDRSFRAIHRINLANRPIILNYRRERERVSSSGDLKSFRHSEYIEPSTKQVMRNYVRLLVHTLDHIIHYYIKIRPKMINGGVVISERYFHDYVCADKRFLPGVNIRLKKILLNAVPSPEYVFVVDVNPSKLYSRKPELSLDQISYEQQRYLNLNFRKTLVDNNGTLKNTLNQIQTILFKING